jgi:NAD(P)-dependent dehydrogenase (short-subunit alcohol dehydrogenase family)
MGNHPPVSFREVDMGLFEGEVALVTGAARGNGAAIAKGLAREGAVVICADVIDAGDVAAAITDADGKALPVTLDVTDEAACQALAAQLADMPVSILINNAGILIRDPFLADDAPATFARTLAVNVQGAVTLTHALRDQLIATKGRVVNIASIQSFAALRNSPAYTTSKAALAQFTKAIAVELAPHGVRVNALAPGIIATDMSAATRADPDRLAGFLTRVPMGRPGEPDELVGPTIFLCSPAASYVTGAVLAVDGGFLAL